MNTLLRLNRKIKHIQSWTRSLQNVAEFPKAIALSQCRSRAPVGSSIYARCMRRLGNQLRVHPKMLNGLSILLRPTDTSALAIYGELFSEGVYDLSSIRFEPDVVLDCGAFQGYFTLLAYVYFPSANLLAFEPSPFNYAAMVSNFSANNLTIDARQQAVSIRSGAMFFKGDGYEGHLAKDNVDGHSIKVQVVDLREVISQLSCRRLLLKLDVEGEEDDILPRLLPILPFTCAILFEWHHSDNALRRLEDTLRSAGFCTERNRTREGPNGILYVDALAIRG
jgi:FkbM family methyltransferase